MAASSPQTRSLVQRLYDPEVMRRDLPGWPVALVRLLGEIEESRGVVRHPPRPPARLRGGPEGRSCGFDRRYHDVVPALSYRPDRSRSETQTGLVLPLLTSAGLGSGSAPERWGGTSTAAGYPRPYSAWSACSPLAISGSGPSGVLRSDPTAPRPPICSSGSTTGWLRCVKRPMPRS